MSVIIVDTSVWIRFFRGGHPALEELLFEARAWITPVIAAELLSGNLSKAGEKGLAKLISELPLVQCPLSHWMATGRLRRRLRQRGFSISTPDAHICQAALDIEGELLTEDSIFSKVADDVGLRLARS